MASPAGGDPLRSARRLSIVAMTLSALALFLSALAALYGWGWGDCG